MNLSSLSDSDPDYPGVSSREVITALALETLAAARSQEERVLDDHTPEALHNYRVAIRRLRSLFASIKEVYPQETTTRWREWLAATAKVTGPVRDLDVHLLSRESMTAQLPESIQEGIAPFYKALRAQRLRAYKRLCQHLNASEYAEGMNRLEAELAEASTLPQSEGGNLAIQEQAAERLLHRVHQLSKAIAALDGKSADEEIHRVRIIGKKLRYLLDFFGELFPGKAKDALRKELARLQRKLGSFNDTSVQQEALARYAQKVQKPGTDPAHLLAIGGLIATLHEEHLRQREKACKALASFSKHPSLRRFRKSLEALLTSPSSDESAAH